MATNTTTKKKSAPKKKPAATSESVVEQAIQVDVNDGDTEVIVDPPVVPTPVVPDPTPAAAVVVAPVRRTYSHNDEIPCRSVRYGVLRHQSKKSGTTYEWADYGDVVNVMYGDLLALKSSKSAFIMKPWFIIEDEQLVEEWKLGELYSYFEDFDDVEEFLRSGVLTVRKKLPNAPQGYKDLVSYTAANMLRTGTLDSIAVIKAIDDILGKELSMLIGG